MHGIPVTSGYVLFKDRTNMGFTRCELAVFSSANILFHGPELVNDSHLCISSIVKSLFYCLAPTGALYVTMPYYWSLFLPIHSTYRQQLTKLTHPQQLTQLNAFHATRCNSHILRNKSITMQRNKS